MFVIRLLCTGLMMQNTTDLLSLPEFLRRYPWQQNETAGRRPADFLWRFEVNAPVADLWPFLIDTSTFNRLLGLPQMKYTEKNGRLFGSSVNAGILSEWEEVPWEWEYHRGLNNARIYSRGFATYVRSRYLLQADGERTIFYVYFGWVPRNAWARLLLKIAMPRLQKDYAAALEKIVQILQTRKDFAARQRALLEAASPVVQNAQAEERLRVLAEKAIADGAPKEALSQLSTFILSAPDEALARIRVKVVARELGLPVSDLVTAALYATRAGILTLSWDVTCPHCRGVRQSVSSLGDIPKEERCDACDITFSSEELGNMEVVFHVNPEIRSVEKKFYCAAEPATTFRSTMVTISGSGFDWHDVDSYFRPNAVSSYSFTPDNKIVTNKFDRLFDVAILMDCSQCPVNPNFAAQFHEYARKHSDSVRRHGAKPVFFMSWAYADAPEMTAQLAEAYTQAGNANGALVVPAGLAFARAIAQRPQLNLYASDKRHPSMLGTYLATATIYATLLKKSPVGLSYTADIDEPTARFLQTVAWETVQDYFRP